MNHFKSPIYMASPQDYNLKLKESIAVTYDTVKNIISEHTSDLDTTWVNIENIITEIINTTPEELEQGELYYFISDVCASQISLHPDYNKLASRICVDRLHKFTPSSMLDVANFLYNNVDVRGDKYHLISDELYDVISRNHVEIQNAIDMSRDYFLDYFGIRTLERSYLFRLHNSNAINHTGEKAGQIVERPQHLFMRVALGIHGYDLQAAFETYHYISTKYFVHATPTLFNAGTPRPQLSSCFLLGMEDDMDNIFEINKQIALISKFSGGIGVHISAVRAKGSIIRGTNGISNGIIPLCGVLNKEGKFVNQGGKRNGSIAVYLEVWHPDVYDFCELRKNTKDEDSKARDLFLSLWVCDLFMKRVYENGMWSLMCPDECPGLYNTYGDEFEKLYLKYEQEKRYKRQFKAINLWYHILECQIETGMPYFLYKDHANRKSNQQNLGTIRSSNLCAEIIEYSDKNETAVCNLASLCLPTFINKETMEYDYDMLQKITRIIVRNLNKIIDRNFYPTENTKRSNMRHRPIGIGVQGLTDVFNIMGYSFGSDNAKILNKKIFETIYYAAISESCELAKSQGKYSSFEGSPFSKGLLQWHLWGLTEKDLLMGFDWETLIQDIVKYGTRNSLLTALMPTASTSQIMGCTEAFEPQMSNIFVRSTLAGEFIVINEQLVRSLIRRNLWSEKLRRKIIVFEGSIQYIKEIPQDLKEIYKTAFEIRQKDIIEQCADRGVFVDQSQSMNLFMAESNFDVLTSCHFTSWKLGLKTGLYYLRTKPGVDAIQFGIDADELFEILEGRDSENENKQANIGFVKIIQKDEDTVEQKESQSDASTEDLVEPVRSCKFRKGVDIKDCDVCSA